MSSTTATVSGALSAGASTLTSVITNTITGTAVGTAVSLYSESSRTAAIEIGNGNSRSGDIRIGNGTSTTGAVLIGRNGGGVSIGTSGSTNTIDGTTNFGNGTHTVFGITNINTTSTLATSIGNSTGALALTGATNTIVGITSITGATTINSGGTATTQLGNNSGSCVVNILGAVSLNATSSIQNTSIGNSTGTISMLGDTTITQTTYPSISTTQIGYTITKTFATTVLSDTTLTFSVVGTGQALGTVKGVYLITCGFELTNSGTDTANNKALCLSLTTGSGTPVNTNGAWEYYEEINDSMGSAGTRYKGTLCGIYIKTTTSAQSLFLNGYANTSGTDTISATGNCSITRIA